MNRFPPEPLNDEERALAALIAREGPHGEPSPALDAKILAAAHSAVAGHTAKRKPRWPVFTGAAASVLLAAGIGWQMLSERDQAAATSEAPANASTAMIEPDRQQAVTAAPEMAPAPAPPPPPPPPPAMAKARLPASAPASPKPVPVRDAAAMAESAAATAAEPTSAPPPPAVIDMPATAQRKAMRAEQRAADTQAAPMMQSAPAPAAAETAAMADGVSLRDIPVETDAQLPERDWLQRIEQRLAQGDRTGARDSLRRFSGKYPRTELPPELRSLLEE